MAKQSIGGMDLNAAKDLVKHVGDRSDSLFLSTCYGAGKNREEIKTALSQFTPGHGKMMMTVQGITDEVARSRIGIPKI